MPRPQPALPLVAASVAAACLLVACTRTPDTALALAESTRQDATLPVSPPADTTGFQRKAGDDLPLPKGFPADILLPERFAVVSVTTMGTSLSVVLRSDVAMATLYEQFRAGQADRGWRETVSMQGVEGAMLGLHKDDRGVVANFRPDMQGSTLVSLSVQPETAQAAP